ncbi:DUF3466 family protein [Aeromonas taiwanensis]|uniref:DUF3466 family protein n=1 Tax=Aeromonas taiwanensis TaxID=633417 RepID=A0A5F0KGA5_9GAMM|nr:DUF3466 family protein [Aeromonas taiwanensis]TFF80834.1 DUF3466 family protein [Aeromonas taiwanensis]TFF81836.1 DUF3466 family protein [Aeromonas taiwanensis]TFF83359.1 DUF3466 family protein [Aeromonas taiwanensis]
MKKQLSMLAILVGASLNAQAAQSSFFTIVDDEVKGYASAISADGSGLVGINTKNNMAEYFSTVRFGDFLVDRFRFEQGCFLSTSVCDTFWDDNSGYTYQWRRDFLDKVDQRSTLGYVVSSEADGLVTALGDAPTDRVGYQVDGKLRTAFAIVDDSDAVDLKDAASTHALSVPTAIKKLDNGQYLVTGTAASGKNHTTSGDFYKYCFEGNDSEYGDFRYCPGVDTQASFWLLNSSGALNKLIQASDYAHQRNEVLQTASALGAAEYNGTLYGVGYSSSGEVGSGDLDGRNIASYWTLDLSAGTVGATKIIPLPEGEPGKDDAKLQHSWAVAVNDNGYVIGNQRYRLNKGQNRPVEMFLFNLNTPTTSAVVPLQDNPLSGSGSEAAAINDHNMVVGWRDSRHQTQPVVNGTNRMQEAFLLNAAAPANSWYLNDLICGTDDAGNKQCAQNGYYYHIAYASGISSDGTIAATAYRYNSESELNNRSNATVVAVKLKPAVVDYQGNTPASYVVSNAPLNNQTGQDGDGGGGGSLFWLTLLALPFAWLRRYQR